MTTAYDALTDLMQNRYSCRGFRPDPVPEDVIRQIVTAAGRTASWCNAQPWQVVVTSGAETDRFRAALQDTVATSEMTPDQPWPDGYPGVYGRRRRTCGMQLYQAVGVARGDRAARTEQAVRNYAFFDAPHVAIVHSEAALGPYGAMDCGGFVTSFMLAATALGVGSVAQASIAAFPDLIRSHFDLPERRQILCGISFGYEDPDHPANGFRTERAALEDVLDLRQGDK